MMAEKKGVDDESGEVDAKEGEEGDEEITNIRGEDIEEAEEDEEIQDEPLENPSTDIRVSASYFAYTSLIVCCESN